MDFSSLSIAALIASIMVAATPILLAAIGELVVEKAGVLNLGVEGMMIVGAIAGFATAVETGSPVMGFIAAFFAGLVLSLIFGVVSQILLSNQVASGLALTLFGLGLAALLGQNYTGIKPPASAKLDIPVLSDLPYLGQILFRHDMMVYVGLLIVAGVWYFLSRTRAGLILRAVGENHDAAHSLGYNVVLIRLGAIAFGGGCAGLGGAHLSLIRVPQWTDGMTAGAGWIALAIVVFASWKPWRVIFGAYLFGGVTILQLNLQALGAGLFSFVEWIALPILALLAVVAVFTRFSRRSLIALGTGVGIFALVKISIEVFGFDPTLSAAYLSMTPYIATIIVLVVMSADRKRASLNAPASLGRTFHASS